MENVRIDKFLWAVRIYKTRSMATDACRKGRVTINNIPVKPSRSVSNSETIMVKKPPVTYTYEVIDIIDNRIAAKMVPGYIRDITSEEEKTKLLKMKSHDFGFRPKGFGRPTKKERRSIDRLNDSFGNMK